MISPISARRLVATMAGISLYPVMALFILNAGWGWGSDKVLFAEGASQSYHASRHRPHPRQRRHGPPRPTDRFEPFDDESSSAYFERNELRPPPPISRRRAQTDNNEAAAATTAAADYETSNSELDSIIQDAKHGEDANARLRYDLIWRHSNFDKYFYDKHSYPWEYIWYNQTGKRTGLPIEVNINFHQVSSVDIVNSVMDLVVWFRMVWVDPRLTWNPEDYGNLNKTWFWLGGGGAGGENSEIWTPDIELWNLDAGLRESLEDTYARVSYDGTVWWGRPGHLKPSCSFFGLDLFPFDKLTCTMEFGSWMLSGKYLRMERFKDVGFTVGGSITSGESYEEYSFVEVDPISCEKHVYTYASAPEDDWPVLLYNVTVARSWQPYARGYVATQIILNLVGFSAFWLPPGCGERMGLSITAMLAAVAAEIVVVSKLPASAEMTWFSKFSLLSLVYAFLSLVENVAVLYFYYKRSEDLVPPWYAFTKNWYLVRKAKTHGGQVKRNSTELVARTANFVTETTSNAVGVLHHSGDVLTPCEEDVGTSPTSDTNITDDGNEMRTGKPCVPNNASSSSPDVNRIIGESGNLRRRSVMTKDFKDQYGNSITALVQAAPKHADDFDNEEEIQNNLKWKHVASRIDDVARFWIPLTFVVSLSIVLAEVL